MRRANPLLCAAWLRIRHAMPTIIACVLVGTGLFLALQSERQAVVHRANQTTVQAKMMAATLTGALAFDDAPAAREYLDALKLNPDIRAAAVYSRAGALVAGFSKADAPLPAASAPHAAVVSNLAITVVEPVHQGRLDLGTVYVESTIEPLAVRLSRYVAVGMMIAAAALLIYLLGRSFSRVAVANSRLQEEIVAREQAEAALVQAQKMEALGQLTGGIAHDFNNLLMAASAGLELLERSSDPARRQRFAQGIRESIERGALLTRQLLTFARRSPVHAQVVDVSERFRGIRNLLDRSLRENIVLVYDLDEGLWPVDVDPVQFEVAIVNIAVNARDAMPQGGTIRISARNVPASPMMDDAVRIAIADEGCGVPADLLAKVFDPFFTTKEVGQGTGLGLSQVYGFVRSAGGLVEIDSAEGRGTTLTLLLPRSTEAPRDTPFGSPDAAPPPVRAQTVLVVEDDPRIAESVCEMLRLVGCSPRATGAPEDALAFIAAHGIDLVISDMVMPGSINGLDLAKALHDRDKPVPVILMTGYSDLAQRARDEGFRLLDKPFSLQALAHAINSVDANTV